jgi:hypothetical protein
MRVSLAAFVISAALTIAGPAHAAPQRSWQTPIKRMFSPAAKKYGKDPAVKIDGYDHLDARQYKDIKAATLTLLRRFPPNNHYFIGLGRDPAPVIAMLQNLGEKHLAVNFPASSNEAGKDTPEVLAQYVQKLIPAEALTSGKTIVFVDATSSGRALNHYVPRLTPHLGNNKVVRAAFANPRWRIWNAPGENELIDTDDFPEVDKFYGAPYEGVTSEYERHAPGAFPISDLDTPRPQYKKFRDALKRRMKGDRDLDRKLAVMKGVEK